MATWERSERFPIVGPHRVDLRCPYLLGFVGIIALWIPYSTNFAGWKTLSIACRRKGQEAGLMPLTLLLVYGNPLKSSNVPPLSILTLLLIMRWRQGYGI
jgi:hypothetical protein